MLGVGLKTLKAMGVDGRTGLGEHQRLPLPQQPGVAGPDDLPGHEQLQTAAQLIAVMSASRGAPSQR